MSEVTGEESTEVTEEVADESAESQETEESKGKGEEESSSSDESKNDDGEKADDADESEDGAPETYAELTIGEDMELPPELLKDVHEWGKSLNLTQEQLQGAADLHVEVMQKFIEHQQEQWETTKAGWESDVLGDKFFHDENGKADAALATSKKAVMSIGGESLMEALDMTGAGSHPAVVRAFFELGQRIEAGSVNVRGMQNAEEAKTGARALYPTMKK